MLKHTNYISNTQILVYFVLDDGDMVIYTCERLNRHMDNSPTTYDNRVLKLRDPRYSH